MQASLHRTADRRGRVRGSRRGATVIRAATFGLPDNRRLLPNYRILVRTERTRSSAGGASVERARRPVDDADHLAFLVENRQKLAFFFLTNPSPGWHIRSVTSRPRE